MKSDGPRSFSNGPNPIQCFCHLCQSVCIRGNKNFFLLLAVGLGTVAGCQTSGPTPPKPRDLTPTQAQAAQAEWNNTRAAVLGSLALDQFKNGNFDKCQSTLDEALQMSPENPTLHLLAAKLAIELGKLEGAESHLQHARALDPKNAEVDYLTGVLLQRWQQPQKAYDAYADAARKNPQELAYVMAQAEMLVALNRSADASDLLKSKIDQFPHSPAIRDALGQSLVEQARYAEGVGYLREASVLATEDQTIREHLGFALYYDKQYNEAAEIFSRLARDQSYAKRADIFGALAECQSMTGQFPEAAQNLETAVQLDPTGVGYWLSLGRVCVQLNDLPRADIAAHRALSIEPASSEAHCLLGYVRLRENRLPQALDAFHTANQLDANDTLSLDMQGYVLGKMGRSDEAIGFYARALKIKPNDELASRLMAIADHLQ